MAQSDRLGKLLGEKLKAEVFLWDRNILSLPPFAQKAANCVDDLTWMRLLWACGGPMPTSTELSSFLPGYVREKRLRETVLRKTTAALAVLAVVLGLGIICQGVNALLLRSEIKRTTWQRSQQEKLCAELRGTDLRIEELKNYFLAIDTIQQRQEDWLRLFSELEMALYDVKDAWLTGFRVMSTRESVMERDPSVVHISGYMLIRETHDPSAANHVDRMNTLIRNLKNCPSVTDLSEILFPPQQGQLQPFQCRLTLTHGRL
jgi:hypothetical protein